MCWQLVDHVGCLVCDFLGKCKDERLPGASGWLCEGEGSGGRALRLQSLVGKVLGLSVSLEWTLRGSGA